MSTSLTILHAQEFIAILSFACLGFAVLLARIRDNKREPEERVAVRTSELQLLNQKSAVLRANICRTGDLVARYGGEEFVFITPGMDSQHALKVSEKIREEIRSRAIPHAMSLFDYVTVSIGVTSFTPHYSQNANLLIKLADEALYAAKNQGRNTIVF